MTVKKRFHNTTKMRAHHALIFPILSVIAHLGMLAMGSAALDMPLLVNPHLVAVFGMAWLLASVAPGAAERLGGLGRALALAVGCPLALLVMGMLHADALERNGHEPVAKAALFALWWHLFFALTIGALQVFVERLPWRRRLYMASIVALVPTLIMYILTLAFVPYW